MTALGVARFRNQDEKMLQADPTATRSGQTLLKSYIAQVSEFIMQYCAGNNPNGRRRNKYAKLLAAVDADKLALMGLNKVIEAVYKESSLATVASGIGLMVEDELRFMKFEAEKPELFAHIKQRMDDNRSEQYRHRHRNLVHGMKEGEVAWDNWSNEVKIGVGSLVLSLCMDATDLVQVEHRTDGKNRTSAHVVPTPELVQWLTDYNGSIEAMTPDRMPCLIEPEKWTGFHDGGYFTRRLKGSTSLVKTRQYDDKELQSSVRALLSSHDIPDVCTAVNGMQGTKWAINTRVLEVMQEVWDRNLGTGMPPTEPYAPPACPLPDNLTIEDMSEDQKRTFSEWKQEAREVYTLEKERRGQVISTARTMRLASMLRVHDLLHFVYQLDFRGRGYCATSGVSPQGTDTAKAVLHFAEAHRVGVDGVFWHKVHGANKFGNDKGSYNDRVAWVDEHKETWLRVASDPVGERKVWGEADKPFQFLAWCFEYAGLVEHGPDFQSRIPIALDGSCNGLQHFSAMLRDPIGGASVNLTPSDRPSDIYQRVADVATEDLREIARSAGPTSAAAQNWLDLFESLGTTGMSRKLSKTPVMTLPYGSTQQACTSSIFSWYTKQRLTFFPKKEQFRHCIFLSTVLWAAIGKVVVAARAAMKWLQRCSGVVTKAGEPLYWHSPLGFPVYQRTMDREMKKISTQIGGRIELRVSRDTGELSQHGQRNGISPNMVHSVDAAHMMMCVNAGVRAGITDFAMIHDDFGVHACHVAEWHRIIREEFHRLHTEHDVLREFKKEHEERLGISLPEVPPRGDLDLSGVLDSPYFFG